MRMDELERIRRTPGASVLLFLTDRCPVGCAHCSVDSRPDSPRVTDFELLDGIVAEIADLPDLQVVGISGGEPFVERRALLGATRVLAAAGLRTVAYTSGVWGTVRPAAWIDEVLALLDTIVFSADAFHADRVPEPILVRALRAAAEAPVDVVVQVLDTEDSRATARAALERSHGPRWADVVAVNPIPPLPYGRAEGLFPRRRPALGAQELGSCASLSAPVVRYDGTVALCCNESVIMGEGPDRLRRRVGWDGSLAAILGSVNDDVMLSTIRDFGVGVLSDLPAFADLISGTYRDVCEACWSVPASRATDGASCPAEARIMQAVRLSRRPAEVVA